MIKEILTEIKNTFLFVSKKALKISPIVLTIANPFVTLIIAFDLYQQYNAWRMEMLLFPLLTLIIMFLISIVKKVTFDDYAGLPVYKRRFTKRDEYNNALFDTRDILEMVAYLAEVEDYFEYHGKYK